MKKELERVRNYYKKIRSLITEIKTSLETVKIRIDTKQERNKYAVNVWGMLYQQTFIPCKRIWILFYRQREPHEYLRQGSDILIYVIWEDHYDIVVRMDGIGWDYGGIKAECLGSRRPGGMLILQFCFHLKSIFKQQRG